MAFAAHPEGSAKSLSGAEDGTETVTTSAANGGAHCGNVTITGEGDGGRGPLRVGIFATNGACGRPASRCNHANPIIIFRFADTPGTAGDRRLQDMEPTACLCYGRQVHGRTGTGCGS